jgi:hypothetical protein
MAIITFTSSSRVPITVERSSVPDSDTWHEIQWPEWTRTLTVKNEDDTYGLYVTTLGMATNSGSLDTANDHYWTIGTSGSQEFAVSQGPGRVHVGTGSLFVSTEKAGESVHAFTILAEMQDK